MANNTYVALDKITVGTAVSSVTFSSIPSTYTDLVIEVTATQTAGPVNMLLTFNGSGTGYSRTLVAGNGTSALSARLSNRATIQLDNWTSPGTGHQAQWNIMSYANTSVYKTIIGRTGRAAEGTEETVGLWQNFAAISSMTFSMDGASNIATGSTFSLYGIKAEPQIVSKATGGTIYYGVDGYVYHKFTSSGTFTPSSTLSCDVLTIAGGGGGGNLSAGGGAGGLLYSTAQSFSSAQTVTIGGGGAGGSGFSGQAASGVNSSVGSLTAIGGGGGGKAYSAGVTGGSGGGAGVFATTGGTATSGQGFAGGTGTSGFDAGGGGGAGAVGGNGTQSPSRKSGDGGVGASSYSQWGIVTSSGQTVSGVVYYAGGGGGGGSVDNSLTVGVGGYGGGAAGNNNGNGYSGTSNTGGGGGGGGQLSGVTYDGGSGGSGIVIIRYAN